MNTHKRCKILAAVFVLFGLPAQADEKLAGYNAAIGESSISGISSGAFMAVQFATAWSSVVKGVGIVAGGPYWCAKADSAWGYWTSVGNATGPCMKGPLGDLNALFAKAEAKAASGEIDPLQFVSRQKVYVFHGYNDVIVARAATDAAAAFYRRYLAKPTAAIFIIRPRSVRATRWSSRRICRMKVSRSATRVNLLSSTRAAMIRRASSSSTSMVP